MSYKGYFKPRNPSKYKGDPTKIVYRSRWELKFMMYLDAHTDVIAWASEEIAIPYVSPIDNRVHRYFPDFVVRKRGKDGKLQTVMVEIKPFKETRPPEVQKKKTKRYIREVYTWGVNDAKWKAAREYCADRKWEFAIFTEYELGIKF